MKKKEFFQTAIILIIAVFLVYILYPFFTGSEKYMIVLSGSMVPLFLPGDIVIVKATNPNELNVGDVLTFQRPGGKPGTMYTHRIISIGEGGSSKGKIRLFETKGDANNIKDDFQVPAFYSIGKLVFVIPLVGLLIDAFRHSKSILFIMVMLPACLLILDEIRSVILYSNPRRARKLEREQKKTARKTYYKIKGKQLLAIIFISGLVFTGIVAFNLGENGPAVLESESKINNSGVLPMVYVMTPDNSEIKFDIHSWYGVISPDNETKVIAPDKTSVQISTAPYILPVFWIIAFAEINPYLPAVAEIIIYTSIFTLILLPIWYKKTIRGNHKKKIRFHRLLAQWKRDLHIG